MQILDAQLTLTVESGNARPDVFINPIGHVICHLTQGFSSATFPTGQGNAITAGAHVPVVPGPRESVSDWSFGFVQVARLESPGTQGFFYAGRMSSEGSMTVNPNVPPALASPVLYDAFGAPPDPWFDTPASSFIPPKVNAGWGDHPALKIPLRLRNTGKNVDNFLFQIIFDRVFWTIFTAVDPAGAIKYIGHFKWQVRYDAELVWANQAAMLRRNKSVATVLAAKVAGAPTDPDLQALLAKPSGARANVLFGQAVNQSFFGARGPNRTENDRWFTTVPVDFWS